MIFHELFNLSPRFHQKIMSHHPKINIPFHPSLNLPYHPRIHLPYHPSQLPYHPGINIPFHTHSMSPLSMSSSLSPSSPSSSSSGHHTNHGTAAGSGHGFRGMKSKICGVCGDRAKSYHFGGISCDSCKGMEIFLFTSLIRYPQFNLILVLYLILFLIPILNFSIDSFQPVHFCVAYFWFDDTCSWPIHKSNKHVSILWLKFNPLRALRHRVTPL